MRDKIKGHFVQLYIICCNAAEENYHTKDKYGDKGSLRHHFQAVVAVSWRAVAINVGDICPPPFAPAIGFCQHFWMHFIKYDIAAKLDRKQI